jgi:N-acetylmuramoyl-L-alanine amidase
VLDLYPPAAPDDIQALIQSGKSKESASAAKPEIVAVKPSTPAPDVAPSAPAKKSGSAEKAPAAPEPVTTSKPATDPAPPSAKATTPASAPARLAALEPADVPPRAERIITVAIDAGHGGEDPGAKGHTGTYEKDVTLSIARRLKAAIDATPGMRGVLVRDGDYFVALHQRVVKARSVEADLFVSIHADAFIKPNARGSSVFALSERGATSAAARWLARKENEADLIGGINLDVPDPNLKKVLLDLSQTATINDSLRLGRAVLNRLSEVNSLHKRHVEQAGFAVLKAPDIPSILVETAFISNPDEEKRLNDEAYQERLTQAIADGIRQYFAKNPPLARVARAEVPSARANTDPSAIPPVAALDLPAPAPATRPEAAAGFQKVAYVPAAKAPAASAQPAKATKTRKAEAPSPKSPSKADKLRKREVVAAPAKPARAAKVATRACCRPKPVAHAGLRLR